MGLEGKPLTNSAEKQSQLCKKKNGKNGMDNIAIKLLSEDTLNPNILSIILYIQTKFPKQSKIRMKTLKSFTTMHNTNIFFWKTERFLKTMSILFTFVTLFITISELVFFLSVRIVIYTLLNPYMTNLIFMTQVLFDIICSLNEPNVLL